MKIFALPVLDRPREKLTAFGATSLSDSELLALLLGSGTSGLSAIELAQSLLRKYGGFSGLLSSSKEELLSNRGIGEGKASFLLALSEIFRRMHRGESKALPNVLSYLQTQIQEIEESYVLCLNAKKEVKATRLVSKGENESTSASFLSVLQTILSLGAKRVVYVHLHPSDIPFPSPEDIRFTLELGKRLSEVGVKLLDHVVLSKAGQYSFLMNGFMKEK